MSNSIIKKITNIVYWIGLFDSLYLSYIKLAHKESICAGFGQCDVVQASSFSQLLGVPIAILGVIAYIALLVILKNESNPNFIIDNPLMLHFGLTFMGFIYSAYLTYIEIDVLHAICPFCVLSAIVMTIALIGTSIRLKRYFNG